MSSAVPQLSPHPQLLACPGWVCGWSGAPGYNVWRPGGCRCRGAPRSTQGQRGQRCHHEASCAIRAYLGSLFGWIKSNSLSNSEPMQTSCEITGRCTAGNCLPGIGRRRVVSDYCLTPEQQTGPVRLESPGVSWSLPYLGYAVRRLCLRAADRHYPPYRTHIRRLIQQMYTGCPLVPRPGAGRDGRRRQGWRGDT